MADQQTAGELREHLEDQLGFLERSADAFDQGSEGEAKRIAASLRVLLHDTASSHSLLGQLGEKERAYVDTALPEEPGNLLPHGGLVWQNMVPGKIEWVAQLDDVPLRSERPFNDWWETPGFSAAAHKLSRKDLVLSLANKDGGAHVDPKLTTAYAELSRKNLMGWTWVDPPRHRGAAAGAGCHAAAP